MLFRSNDTATTEIYTTLDTLSLHDALPLSLLVTTWQDEHPDLDVHFIGVRPVSNEFGAPLSDGVAAARTEIVAIFRESLAGSERPAEEQRG